MPSTTPKNQHKEKLYAYVFQKNPPPPAFRRGGPVSSAFPIKCNVRSFGLYATPSTQYKSKKLGAALCKNYVPMCLKKAIKKTDSFLNRFYPAEKEGFVSLSSSLYFKSFFNCPKLGSRF